MQKIVGRRIKSKINGDKNKNLGQVRDEGREVSSSESIAVWDKLGKGDFYRVVSGHVLGSC